MTRPKWLALLAWTTALWAVLFFGLPLVWVVVGSLSRSPDLAAGTNVLYSGAVSFEGFSSLFADQSFLTQFKNSAVCAILCSVIAVAIGCFVGYAATRRIGMLARVLVNVSLVGYAISPVVLAIPLFVAWNWLGLTNSRAGLVVAHLSFAIPYAMWSMRGFFNELPRTLEERAAADGLSPRQTVARVILPAVAPGVITTLLFCFLLSWNDYVFARVLVGSESVKTLTIGIDDMFHGSLVNWAKVLAAGTITTVPALLVVVILQRQLGRGAMSTWR